MDITSLQAYAEKDTPTFSGTATFNGPIISNSTLTQVGAATFNNDIQTNQITGKDGNSIEYKTTTALGIHNFKINGTQMTFINNLVYIIIFISIKMLSLHLLVQCQPIMELQIVMFNQSLIIQV